MAGSTSAIAGGDVAESAAAAELDALLPRGAEESVPRLEAAAAHCRAQAQLVRARRAQAHAR
jgi:hypothetical protein